MDLAALIVSIVAMVGAIIALLLATDPWHRPKILASRRKRHGFICPCGHDYVFHAREGGRRCEHRDGGYEHNRCGCRGYGGTVPPPTYEELMGGAS